MSRAARTRALTRRSGIPTQAADALPAALLVRRRRQPDLLDGQSSRDQPADGRDRVACLHRQHRAGQRQHHERHVHQRLGASSDQSGGGRQRRLVLRHAGRLMGATLGFAWDVFGDGKTAVRASGGIFYNFINRSQDRHNGGAMFSRTRTVRNGVFAVVTAAGRAPIRGKPGAAIAGRLIQEGGSALHGLQIPQGTSSRRRTIRPTWPSSATSASTRSPKSLGDEHRPEFLAGQDDQQHPAVHHQLVCECEPEQPVQQRAISANFLRRDYPGMGSLSYLQPRKTSWTTTRCR